jgi:ATP-binding cassette, subfamily B, bacterial PglK
MKSYRIIYSLLTSKEKKFFKFLILMMFFAMIMETLGIALIIPIMNLFTNQSEEFNLLNFSFFENIDEKVKITLLTILVFSVYLIKNSYLALFYYLETKFSYNFRYNLGARLFNYYLSKSYSFHLKEHSSKLITKINQETQLAGSSLMSLSILMIETLIILGITILILIVRPIETILIIGITSIFSTFYYLYFKKKSLFFGSELAKSQKSKMKVLNESLFSIKEIILFKAKNFFSQKFQNESDHVSSLNYKMVFINRLPKIYFEIILLVIIISIIFYSAYENKSTMTTISTLSIFLISSLKVMPSLNKILVALQSIKYSQASIESLKQDVDNIQDQEILLSSQKNYLINNFKKIVYKDLSFRYPNNKNYILKNINFEINPNEFIAVVGKTGEGKTTFINLLAGILQPTEGEVLVDDKKIINNNNLINLIGYVPQSIFLYDDSIKKNIAFGVEEKDISTNRISDCIAQSQLSKFIKDLGNNYDFRIGENASWISGGQKQRVAIARALYNDPKILILDEPTSSLDKKTSEEVLQHLKNLSKNKTVIMITHKLENTSLFSKIFEVNNKKITKIN